MRKMLFRLRMLLDFHVATVYNSLKKSAIGLKGSVLDIGCGQSPYKHLFEDGRFRYHGVDINDSGNFGYLNLDVTHFDGENIPFGDESFDVILCTEVIEHVANPSRLISEMGRVLKPGGTAVITAPWSLEISLQALRLPPLHTLYA